MSHDENMSSSSSSQAPVGAAKQVNRNPLWELAEAIHTDDASNLFTYIERCNAVTKFQPHSEAGSRDSSNKVAQQVGNIYAMLQHKIAATNLQDAILNVAASVNRVAIARAILANNAANGVEWGSRQESALDAACANGHLEVATVIACVEDDQVTLILDQSLALRYHCLAGDIKHVREVLASDSPDVTIKAALLDACRSGRCDIVALLTADARFDPSVDGYEALRLACMQGHVEVVALLLHHLDLSTGAQELNDALTLATDAGQCDVVALLVHDERVNPGLDKSFALEHYCLAGDVTRVKEALDDPDFVTAPLPGALLAGASRNGHAAIVELLLLDPRVDPTADDNAAIQLASECGHDSVVKLLLADPRVDPAADDNSAIRYSSIYGEDSVVKLLLADPRVDPAAHKNFAIQASSGRGHESVVKLLLADPRVDPAAHNNFTIRRASSGGHARVLKLLLADPRVDPTALDNRAIRLATYNGHASVVELLLADPRVDPAADINDAIRHGSANGHASVVKLLLDDQRVDPTAEENFAIREACFAGHASVVKLLLADPRVDPSMGHPTALERASREGHVDIVKMLLEYPKVVVTKAALVDADEGHHDDVIRLLIDKQPQVLHDLFEDTTSCVSSGALENELRHREKASALTLLLAVERLERAVRASDVLRTVIVEYACFDLIDNTADDSSSTTSDDSGASSSSEGRDAEASDASSDD